MLHGKQFAITDHEIKMPGYRSVMLHDGNILSWHERLPAAFNKDKSVVLLGNAYKVLAYSKTPQEEICNDNKEEIRKAENAWWGRYVLFIEGTVITDALGLLGVFYSPEGVSSDIAFLTDQESKWRPHPPVSYFPPAGSPWKTIKRLLPSQEYDIKSRKIKARDLIVETESDGSIEELAKDTANMLCRSLCYMQEQEQDRKMLVSLSGGKDSRVVLAAAKRAGLEFETFTFERTNIPPGDVEFSPLLAAACGVKHTYYERKQEKYSHIRKEEFLRNISYMAEEEDANFFAYSQYEDFNRKPVIILRGGGAIPLIKDEFGKCVNEDYTPENILNYFEIRKKNRQEEESIRELLEWFRQTPQKIPAHTRFSWEYMMCGWLSEVEHGFDIYDNLTPLAVGNSRVILSNFCKMADFPNYHDYLLEQMQPELLKFPYANNTDAANTKIKRLKRNVSRGIRRVRNIGPVRTVKVYKDIQGYKKNAKHTR